jgi:hypothetical protein
VCVCVCVGPGGGVKRVGAPAWAWACSARVLPYVFSMQNAWTLLPFTVSLAPSYFSTLTHKRHDFRKKKLLNIKCVLIFSTAFV